MPDLWHTFGGDLAIGPTGDLATASDADKTRQRVLRRLLTNPGAYFQHVAYGAGLPQLIGTPASGDAIQALVRQQMGRERGVAPLPLPTTVVVKGPNGQTGISITYGDLDTDQVVQATGAI